MKKLFVEDVKVGVSEGGMACGPVPGNVVAEVCLRDVETGKVKYYSMAEVEGIPNFCEMDVSTYDAQIADDPDDPVWDELAASASDFSSYTGFFDYKEELEKHDEVFLHVGRLLIYLVRSSWEDAEKMQKACIGKHLGEFEIPMSDVEQEYLEDQEEEEQESEEPATEEELLENVRSAFVGSRVDTGTFVLDEPEEDHNFEGSYTSHEDFKVGDRKYRLTYDIDLDENGEILYIAKPDCKRLEEGNQVSCAEGEVSLKQIYQVLFDAIEGWM